MITLVSNSSLSSLAKCETQFVLSYVLGYQGERESAYAVAGSAAHEALAAYFQGHSAEQCLKLFRALYEPFVDDPENYIEERMSFENTYAALEIWFARHPLSKMPFISHPDKVELRIEEPLDDNGEIRYVAVLDLLAEAKHEDTWVVCDHKSTRAISEWMEKKFVNGSQMTSYIWAARRYMKDASINRAFINAIVFKKLNRTFTKCRISGHGKYAECWPEHVEYRMLGPYERTKEQLEDWHRTALYYAKKFVEYYDRFLNKKLTQPMMNSLNVDGTLIDECRWCSFQPFCSFGRNVNTLDGKFNRRPRPDFGEGRTGVWDDDEQ